MAGLQGILQFWGVCTFKRVAISVPCGMPPVKRCGGGDLMQRLARWTLRRKSSYPLPLSHAPNEKKDIGSVPLHVSWRGTADILLVGIMLSDLTAADHSFGLRRTETVVSQLPMTREARVLASLIASAPSQPQITPSSVSGAT